MFGLPADVFLDYSDAHTPDASRQITPPPQRRRQSQLFSKYPPRIGLDRLDDLGDRLRRTQTEQATQMIRVHLRLQQVIFVPLANLMQRRFERLNVFRRDEY